MSYYPKDAYNDVEFSRKAREWERLQEKRYEEQFYEWIEDFEEDTVLQDD